MKIENFERYSLKLNKILDNYDEFCKSLNQEADVEIIEKIKKIKATKEDENKVTKEKALCLMYITAINFLPTDKVKGDFPLSEKFLSNMIAIIKDQRVIYHSHVTGKIIGYAHDFCNEKIRENYFTIPVIAHNQFRFYFFFYLKGIKPYVWETKQISIGGKNGTSINYAIIKNQVQFIDTTKFFQQNLAILGDSRTETERENVRD